MSYEILEPLGGEVLVRLVYYPTSRKRLHAGMYYPFRRGAPVPERGKITFNMPAFQYEYAPKDRFLVVFVELGTLKNGKETIESNALATLVYPLRPAAGAPKGKQ